MNFDLNWKIKSIEQAFLDCQETSWVPQENGTSTPLKTK